SLVLSSPLAILVVMKIRQRSQEANSNRPKLIAIFIGLILFLSSGVAYEIAGEAPESMSLDSHIDYPRFTAGEISAADWLAARASNISVLYSDVYRALLIKGILGVDPTPLTTGFNLSNSTVYVFLGKWNLEHHEIVVYDFTRNGIVARHVGFANTPLARSLALMTTVFSNSDAEILTTPKAN